MSFLITSIAKVREAASDEGFALFCAENEIDPGNWKAYEREEGFAIESPDLLRYGMDADHAGLKADIEELVGPRL